MVPLVPQQVIDRIDDLPERISDLVWRWEARSPAAVAVIDGDVRWSFADLAEAVREAKALLTDHGIRPGDRVMVVNENGRAIVALALAAAALDAWSIIVNARQTAAEIAIAVEHAGIRRAFFTIDASPAAAVHAAEQGAEVISHRLLGRIGAGALNERTMPEPVQSSGAEQVALLVYTSGTTGSPKGVMLTHRNLGFIAAMSGGMRGFAPGDMVYGVLPLSHVFGFASVFLGSLYAGACYMPRARFEAAQLLDDIGSGITHLSGAPAMFGKFLSYLRQEGRSLGPHNIRFTSAGGAPLDMGLKQACEALFGQPLHNGYGMTEAAPSMAMTRVDFPRADGSVGQALPHVELVAVGPDGEAGCRWRNGRHLVPGARHDEGLLQVTEMTAQAITPEGWLKTGDVGFFDSEGSLHISGRSKELIIRSGFNVFPPEVESVLSKHPGVILSAVVGQPAGDGNEEVVAYVQVNPSSPPSVEELAALCASQLAPYKRPVKFILCSSLPATPMGKVLKHRLAAEAVPLAELAT